MDIQHPRSTSGSAADMAALHKARVRVVAARPGRAVAHRPETRGATNCIVGLIRSLIENIGMRINNLVRSLRNRATTNGAPLPATFELGSITTTQRK